MMEKMTNNIIAVASGKGGVGKTWFSITLCQALAKRGQRVLLFDGDLGLANVDIQLGLTPDKDLGAVIDGRATLQGAITRFDNNFDILAGRSGSGNLASLPSQRLSELRGSLIDTAKSYDKVILDLGAGVDRSVRFLSEAASMSLIVATDEPTSITDAYAFIKVSRAAIPHADMRIVVNMATNAHDGDDTYKTIQSACQNFLQYSPPLAGIIRRDSKVRDAIRAQMPLLVRSPNTEAAVDVETIASRL